MIHGEQRQGGDSTDNLCETIKRLRDLLVADSEGGSEAGGEGGSEAKEEAKIFSEEGSGAGSKAEEEGGSKTEEEDSAEAEEEAADHTHTLVHRPHLATFPSLEELMALPHAWSAEERAALLGDWFWEEHPSRIVADFLTSCQDGVDAADDADYADVDATKVIITRCREGTLTRNKIQIGAGLEPIRHVMPPHHTTHRHLTPRTATAVPPPKRAVLLFASRATVEKDTGHMLGGTEAPLPPSPPRHCHLAPLHLTSPHRTS